MIREYGEFDVSLDRNDYIGGSDIPAILGISKFTTRWQLLLQKAGLEERGFKGNRFTDYGHKIEPKIREHINRIYNTNFRPNRVINGDIRYHADGFNEIKVLEVKSTSEIYSTVDDYKSYLSQLLFGMQENKVDEGILAVYERPEDFSLEFDPKRLQVFEVSMGDYGNLMNHINKCVAQFRDDLKRLKENPLLSEQDFLPIGNGLITLANKIVAFENQLAAMKEVEQQLKDAKKQLYTEMKKHNVTNWTSPNGTKITRVDEVPSGTKTVTEFDEKAFRADSPNLYRLYLKTEEKKSNGRAGYVRITVK
jgi:predicted phage-related endonuclease